MYTIIALITGMTAKIMRAINTALHSPSIERMDAPKYANTNAYAIYPTVSKASPVPI